MDNQCLKCGSDADHPGLHWFVKGHKLYFCAYCANVLKSTRSHDDLLASFLSRDWHEKLQVSEETKNIIEARIRRSRGISLWEKEEK